MLSHLSDGNKHTCMSWGRSHLLFWFGEDGSATICIIRLHELGQVTSPFWERTGSATICIIRCSAGRSQNFQSASGIHRQSLLIKTCSVFTPEHSTAERKLADLETTGRGHLTTTRFEQQPIRNGFVCDFEQIRVHVEEDVLRVLE